jgi:hypothetical protein
LKHYPGVNAGFFVMNIEIVNEVLFPAVVFIVYFFGFSWIFFDRMPAEVNPIENSPVQYFQYLDLEFAEEAIENTEKSLENLMSSLIPKIDGLLWSEVLEMFELYGIQTSIRGNIITYKLGDITKNGGACGASLKHLRKAGVVF